MVHFHPSTFWFQDCGHAPSQDDELFDQRQSPDAAASAQQRVVLAYDERMTLHVEGQGSSHPERPDRIRAVMARLTASGITGLSYLLLHHHLFTACCWTCAKPAVLTCACSQHQTNIMLFGLLYRRRVMLACQCAHADAVDLPACTADTCKTTYQ